MLIAKFEIHDTFKITGRGVVLAGIILEGQFKVGDITKFDFNNQTLERKIIEIDHAMRAKEGRPKIGLMIETLSEQETNELTNWTPHLTVVEITPLS